MLSTLSVPSSSPCTYGTETNAGNSQSRLISPPGDALTLAAYTEKTCCLKLLDSLKAFIVRIKTSVRAWIDKLLNRLAPPPQPSINEALSSLQKPSIMETTALASSPDHTSSRSTEPVPPFLTTDKFKETCGNINNLPRTTEKRDNTPEPLAMTINNEEVANKVAQVVRQAYKAGRGSSNKAYLTDMATGEWKETAQDKASRNESLKDIRLYLNQMHTCNDQRETLKKIAIESSPLIIEAGNCYELAMVAAKEAIKYGAHAEKWRFCEYDHAFTVIGKPPEGVTVDFKTWKDCYIVDPWANIVCKAPEYLRAYKKKMFRWALKGKVIAGDFYQDASFKVNDPIDQNSINAIMSGKKIREIAPSCDNNNPWAHFSASMSE